MSGESVETRLTVGQKFGWAVGAHGTSTMIGVLVTYLLNYMTDTLGIAAFTAGVIIFAARMYDLITDPVMGYISDRTRSRWGRRYPYLLLGALALSSPCSTFLRSTAKSPWRFTPRFC